MSAPARTFIRGIGWKRITITSSSTAARYLLRFLNLILYGSWIAEHVRVNY